MLKPFYKNSDIFRFSTNCYVEKYILFLGKDIKNESELIRNFPLIYNHLKPFRQIMIDKRLSLNEKTEQWFTLNRGTGHPEIFVSPKIVCPQRSKTNTFGYNECDWLIINRRSLVEGKRLFYVSSRFATYYFTPIYYFLNRNKKQIFVLNIIVSRQW